MLALATPSTFKTAARRLPTARNVHWEQRQKMRDGQELKTASARSDPTWLIPETGKSAKHVQSALNAQIEHEASNAVCARCHTLAIWSATGSGIQCHRNSFSSPALRVTNSKMHLVTRIWPASNARTLTTSTTQVTQLMSANRVHPQQHASTEEHLSSRQ